jgi:hypothetical protein
MSKEDRNIKSFLKPRKNSRYSQGYFMPKNPEKYRGDATQIIYRSGWEHRFLKFCDDNPMVLEYSSEPVGIDYWNSVDKRQAKYWIDGWMKTKNKEGYIKEWLIEIKPNKFIKPPVAPSILTEKQTWNYIRHTKAFIVNTDKFKAAKAWAKAHNMQFGIITENFLFNKM